VLFKCVIAAMLPQSWDHFTKLYVQGSIDKMDRDPHKHIDSQSLIGLIKREYESNKSRKTKEASNAKEKDGSHNGHANRNSRSSNGRNRNLRDHCNHCRKDGHKTRDCHFLDKPKCEECSKWGHSKKDCYSKLGNKRPNGRKEKEGSNKRYKREANNSEANNTDNAKDADSTVEVNVVVHSADKTANNKIVIPGKIHVMIAKEEEIVNTADGQADDSNSEYFDKTPLFNEDGVLAYDWLADLGTTSHITYQCNAYATYEPIEQIPIKGISSVKTFAIGKGTIFLSSKCDGKVHTIKLRDILHVPSNRNNLLAAGNWEECRRYFLR